MKNIRLFFYCVPHSSAGQAQNEYYQHLSVCLGEGLTELGCQVHSNTDYWQQTSSEKKYLFSQTSESLDQFDVVVISHYWKLLYGSWPADLFNKSRSYKTVLLDDSDGVRTVTWDVDSQQFDLILKTHFCKRIRHPSNVRPWAFGLSNRILKAVYSPLDWSERSNALLVNFREAKHAHTVRKTFCKDVLPVLASIMPVDCSVEAMNHPLSSQGDEYLYWCQTGRRHYSAYYQRLIKSKACAALGGFFQPYWPTHKNAFAAKAQRALIKQLSLKTKIISQWDSWRFWESLASGCTVLQIDLSRYDCCLPAMPINQYHYVGINLSNLKETLEIASYPDEKLRNIASYGKRWAVENYSPTPTARRFLNLLDDL